MKNKMVSIVTYLFILTSALFAQAPDWGEADTIASHKLGPGINYSNIYFKGKKMLIWVTEIDLTNPHNKIEQVQSNHKVPDLTRWTVPEHYKQNSKPGHKVCVAFNHDFFSYEGGICIGLNISEGEIPYGGGWGRSLLAIDNNKKASVFQPQLDAQIILPDNSKVKIDFYNNPANGLSGDCILFNRFNALTLTEQGKYIKIKPNGVWTVNGNNIPCEVLAVSSSPMQSSSSEYIIYVRNNKLTSFDKVKTGDVIHIAQQLNSGSFGTPLTNILNAFHGYPSIAFEGKLHNGEYNDFEGGREYEISSHLMAGTSKDGNTLYIVTTEMSKTSVGVNCIDLANYMLSIGAWHVVNFDSGGSVAIVVDEKMLNYPARDAIRPVMDALLAVSLAPESKEITSYSFLSPSIRPSAASSTQLTLMSFNEYDEVISNNETGFNFTCIPGELGYVDSNQVFHAGLNALTGKIIAEKAGKQTEIQVYTRQIENISINPDNILIDKRSYPIVVETNVDNTVFKIDPSTLQWQVDNPTICSIDNGILRGISNGETTVTGTLGSITKTMNVKVEIGTGIQTEHSFSQLNDFAIKTTGIGKISITQSETKAGSIIEFDFMAGRAPYIELTKDVKLYGIPDSLTWKYFIQDKIVKECIFSLEDAKGSTITSRTGIQNENEQTISILFSTNDNAWDLSHFPVTFKKFKMNLNSGAIKKYALSFSDLHVHYPETDNTKINYQYYDNKLINLHTKGQTIYFDLNLQNTKYYSIHLLSIDGRLIKHINASNSYKSENLTQFSISDVNPGIYVIKVVFDTETASQKIIVY